MKKTEKIRKNVLLITIRYTERDRPFNIWEKVGDNRIINQHGKK
jgi:hypothetical protein